MQPLIRAILVIAVTLLVLPELGIASIIFEPGKKAKYVAPGEEEMSGDAAELYQVGQNAEKGGDLKRAIRAYKSRCAVMRIDKAILGLNRYRGEMHS